MHNRTVWHCFRWAVAALALACLAVPALTADDAAALKKRALALNDVTGDKAINGQVNVLSKDKNATKKLLAEARKMVAGKSQPFNYNASYILARSAEILQDYDTALFFYRTAVTEARKVKSAHQLAVAYAGVLEVLFNAKKYDDYLKASKEVLELKDNSPFIRRLKVAAHEFTIRVLAQQGKTKEAVELADRLAKANPQDWRFLEDKAVVLRQAGRNAAAVDAYKEVMARIPKDPNLDKDQQDALVMTVRYILSGLYIDMDQVHDAIEQLKILIAARPNNATYNNDLGYIMADHDMNLPEAERMIRKALREDRKQRRRDPDLTPEQDHDNAAYLDSLGWVLFKEHKYDEAIKELVKATTDKDLGQSAEIYDHLGQAYMAIGKRPEAIAAWKKAIKLAKTPREKKIKAQLEKRLKAAEQTKISEK